MAIKILTGIQRLDTPKSLSAKVSFEFHRRSNKSAGKGTAWRNRALALVLFFASIALISANFNTARANDLPVIQKYGTLQEDETWLANHVYMITDTLTIPAGITLTINPGAIVKHTSNYWGSHILVNSGGTLNAIGTSNDPVIFTSYKDDSVGGDSNGDGASSGSSSGDYSKSVEANGGEVNIVHSVMRYGGDAVIGHSESVVNVGEVRINNMLKAFHLIDAETTAMGVVIEYAGRGILVAGGKANFSNTAIMDTTNGLEVNYGAEVAFRGSFNNISEKAIKSCNWGQNCAVDAAYVDWGNAAGPTPSGGDSLICGQVAVSPWVHNATTHDSGIFSSPNCDGSPPPSASMSSGISHFQNRVSIKQIDCSNGFQDACDAINSAMACLGGAMSLAQSQLPWPLPPATSQQEINAFAAGTVDAASTYLTSQATQTVTGFSFGMLGHVAGAVSTMVAIGSAYNSCAP